MTFELHGNWTLSSPMILADDDPGTGRVSNSTGSPGLNLMNAILFHLVNSIKVVTEDDRDMSFTPPLADPKPLLNDGSWSPVV